MDKSTKHRTLIQETAVCFLVQPADSQRLLPNLNHVSIIVTMTMKLEVVILAQTTMLPYT